MSDLNCEIQKIQPGEALTVGERFALNCRGEQGETGSAWDAKTLELRVDKQDQYKLKLLRADLSKGLRLEVVSDQVGKHEIKAAQLVDAQHSAVILPLHFEVQSVQNAKNPVQEPYGPMGPFTLSVPWFYWMGLLGVLSFIGLVTALRVMRRLERRRLMQAILDSSSGSKPEATLFQSLRRFQREFPILLTPAAAVPGDEAGRAIQQLNEAYRLFLSRVFLLPAANWTTAKTLRTLRREHKEIATAEMDRIRRLLRELDRSSSAKLHAKDLSQMAEWVRESASELTKYGGTRA